VSDTSVLAALVEEVLNENPQSIVDYHAGKDRALGFLVGQFMKKSKGTSQSGAVLGAPQSAIGDTKTPVGCIINPHEREKNENQT
jgi:Asp-tRNA(Asn)/Glu-tRNA(Gln) amidotransferase B subunit